MIIFLIFALLLVASVVLMLVGRFNAKNNVQKLSDEFAVAQCMRQRAEEKYGYRSAEYDLASKEEIAREKVYNEARRAQSDWKDFADTWKAMSVVVGVLFAIVILVTIMTRSPMVVAQYRVGLQEKYTSLTIRIKEQAYQDNFDMFDQQIFEEVQTWNTEVQRKHLSLNNPWVNWFISPAYAEFEAIDYNTIIVESGG